MNVIRWVIAIFAVIVLIGLGCFMINMRHNPGEVLDNGKNQTFAPEHGQTFAPEDNTIYRPGE